MTMPAYGYLKFKFSLIFLISGVLSGCDIIPKNETYKLARAESMQAQFESHCLELMECVKSKMALGLTFTLQQSRKGVDLDDFKSGDDAKLEEYYGRNGTKVSVPNDRRNDVSLDCLRSKFKTLNFKVRNPTFIESYQVRLVFDPPKKCSAIVEDTWLGDKNDSK